MQMGKAKHCVGWALEQVDQANLTLRPVELVLPNSWNCQTSTASQAELGIPLGY